MYRFNTGHTNTGSRHAKAKATHKEPRRCAQSRKQAGGGSGGRGCCGGRCTSLGTHGTCQHTGMCPCWWPQNYRDIKTPPPYQKFEPKSTVILTGYMAIAGYFFR